MQTLINKDTCPPGEFRYVVLETKQRFKAICFDDLLHKVRAHYKANSIDVPKNLPALMEDQMCGSMPPGICQQNDPSRPYVSVTRSTIKTVIAGTLLLASWMLGGRKKVDRATAIDRARICSGCSFNQLPDGCTACSMSDLLKAVNTVVQPEPIPGDELLQSCLYCSCNLKAKVWLPLDFLQQRTSPETNQQLPAYCWLKK